VTSGVLPKGRVDKKSLAFARTPKFLGVLPKGRYIEKNDSDPFFYFF